MDKNNTDDVPELESIRDSDGIAMNATKVLSIRQTKEGVLKMEVKKNRYGAIGGKVAYNWDIDTGCFTYLPTSDSTVEETETRERTRKRQTQTKEDVF